MFMTRGVQGLWQLSPVFVQEGQKWAAEDDEGFLWKQNDTQCWFESAHEIWWWEEKYLTSAEFIYRSWKQMELDVLMLLSPDHQSVISSWRLFSSVLCGENDFCILKITWLQQVYLITAAFTQITITTVIRIHWLKFWYVDQ